MEETKTPAATPVQKTEAVSGKKSPEQFVKEIKSQAFELRKQLPPRFQWRGINYVTANLTDAELQKFADDKGFKHIEKKK